MCVTSSSLLCVSGRSRHTRCALVTGVQTCALPVSYVSNVTKPDGPPAPDGDLRLSQRIGILRIAQHANGLFRPRDFGAATRRIKVDLTKLLIDLRRCDALRLQLGRIQDHADFAADPSTAPHCGHAFYA